MLLHWIRAHLSPARRKARSFHSAHSTTPTTRSTCPSSILVACAERTGALASSGLTSQQGFPASSRSTHHASCLHRGKTVTDGALCAACGTKRCLFVPRASSFGTQLSFFMSSKTPTPARPFLLLWATRRAPSTPPPHPPFASEVFRDAARLGAFCDAGADNYLSSCNWGAQENHPTTTLSGTLDSKASSYDDKQDIEVRLVLDMRVESPKSETRSPPSLKRWGLVRHVGHAVWRRHRRHC